MKLRFDPNLEYQKRAIEAVMRLFEGQPAPDIGFRFLSPNGVVGNRLDLSNLQLLANLQAVQRDPELHEGRTLPASSALDSLDFSIEMETGTGKTYVYLRTSLELNVAYGFRKFIIVVPSVAIREGVIKTFEITRDHFARLYENLPYRFYQYDSGNLALVRQFATSNDVEFMVMTLDSFNKDTNIFNRVSDRMMGHKPIDLVQAARPILILDEPQNMESEISRAALASLNPLFKLRYSASHRELYNLVYRLTPIDAYNLRLVKQIEVASVVQDHDANRAYIACLSVDAKKTVVSARLKVFIKGRSGPRPAIRTVRQGDDLESMTGLDAYAGYTVEGLHAGWGEVTFTNSVVINVGDELGPDHQAIAEAQIAYTIGSHMRKAYRLRIRGIKVLSLFFIDEVANYIDLEGYIRKTFEREFDRLKSQNAPWAQPYRDADVRVVQSSYFSEYKSDSYIEADANAYDLILKDKERLLSLDEPVEFIFSHSALREGWDNPNVFQICTLNQTVSTIRKRQEIGRGMRLAVDQSGRRIFDEQVNRLTVVANESYHEYVAGLQREYTDAVGGEQVPPQPPNARLRRTISLKKGFELDPEFQELWRRIARRTRYRVRLDEEILISECAEAVSHIDIGQVYIRTETGRIVQIAEKGDMQDVSIGVEVRTVDHRYPVPNLTDSIASQTQLTRRTVRRILERAGNLRLAFDSPADFVQQCTEVINHTMRRYLVDGLRYMEVNDVYEMSLFEDVEAYENKLVPVEKSIYTDVQYDSNTERDFAQALDEMDEVKLFIKLPDWFTVPTPIGEYNPDWAIVFHIQDAHGETREKLYLVRETKGGKDPDSLRLLEKLKIDCARQHFDLLEVNYDVEDNATEMREAVIRDFKNFKEQ